MMLGEGVTGEEIIAGRLDDLRRSAADEVHKKKLYEKSGLQRI